MPPPREDRNYKTPPILFWTDEYGDWDDYEIWKAADQPLGDYND